MSETKYVGFGDVEYVVGNKNEKKEINLQVSQQPTTALKKKGDRHSKTRKHLNVRIDYELFERIKVFCDNKQVKLQDFVVMATNHYLQTTTNRQEDLTNNQKDLFKTDITIIDLYQKLTGKKWRLVDDTECQTLANATTNEILVGLCQTYLNAKGKKINSFKYFLSEIQFIVNERIDPNLISAILRRRINQINEQNKKNLEDLAK